MIVRIASTGKPIALLAAKPRDVSGRLTLCLSATLPLEPFVHDYQTRTGVPGVA